MFDDFFRKVKDQLIKPIAVHLGWLHPNVVTVLALLAALYAAWLGATGAAVWGTGWWLFSRLLDGLDGTLARFQQRQSDLGGYLDILLDFVAYAAVPIALVLGHPGEWHDEALAVMLACFYVNAASWMYLSSILEKRASGARSRGEITTVAMPGGLVGGTETIIAYSLFILLAPWLLYLYVTFSVLVVITIGQRFLWAMHNL